MHGSFHGNVTHAHFSPHVSCVCFPPRILVRQIDVQVMMSKQALWQMKTSINLLGTSLFDGEREGGRHVFLIRTYVNGGVFLLCSTYVRLYHTENISRLQRQRGI